MRTKIALFAPVGFLMLGFAYQVTANPTTETETTVAKLVSVLQEPIEVVSPPAATDVTQTPAPQGEVQAPTPDAAGTAPTQDVQPPKPDSVLSDPVQLPSPSDQVAPPAIEQPAIDQPVIEQPAIDQPVIEQPAIEQPVMEQLVMAAPMVDCCQTCCVTPCCCCPPPPAPMIFCLVDPCGCTHEACINVPACCGDTQPCITWSKGLFGRQFATLCWTCCNHRVEVLVTRRGEVRVRG